MSEKDFHCILKAGACYCESRTVFEDEPCRANFRKRSLGQTGDKARTEEG